MEIKATSKYDWETVREFNLFHQVKRRLWLYIVLIVLVIFSVLGFALLAACNLLTIPLVALEFIVFYCCFMVVFRVFILPKIRFNKNKVFHDAKNTFVFGEYVMQADQYGENASSAASVRYAAIWRIYETDRFFYIYINSRQAYVVDKSTVTGNTAEGLRMFLVKAVGMSKYKVKCRKKDMLF